MATTQELLDALSDALLQRANEGVLEFRENEDSAKFDKLTEISAALKTLAELETSLGTTATSQPNWRSWVG